MHARDDAQMAKECSLEYGATTASPTSPTNEANDVSKATLSPTKQLGSAREYFQWTMNISAILSNILRMNLIEINSIPFF